MKLYTTIVRPVITEKAAGKKDGERTLCFEVAKDSTKTEIKQAVQTLFKVKVEEVRTVTHTGKLRRRGMKLGYAGDWKKAYVRLRAGEKIPEFADL